MDVIFHMNEHETEHTPPVLDTLIQILSVLREYCTPQERDQIDMILNILDITSVTGILNL